MGIGGHKCSGTIRTYIFKMIFTARMNWCPETSKFLNAVFKIFLLFAFKLKRTTRHSLCKCLRKSHVKTQYMYINIINGIVKYKSNCVVAFVLFGYHCIMCLLYFAVALVWHALHTHIHWCYNRKCLLVPKWILPPIHTSHPCYFAIFITEEWQKFAFISNKCIISGFLVHCESLKRHINVSLCLSTIGGSDR